MREPTGPERFQERVVRRAQQARSVGYATMIPTMMAAGPLLGYGLGALLERRFGHAPWLSVGCMVLGGIASVRQLVLLLKRSSSADQGSGHRPRRPKP